MSNAAMQHYHATRIPHIAVIEAGHLARLRDGEFPMKKTILAAIAALSLGTSAVAFAQPPAGSTPEYYGGYASADHRNEPQVHFLGQGTVFGRLFGHSDNGQAVANKTAVTPAKGS
jgi:hypothetical protein